MGEKPRNRRKQRKKMEADCFPVSENKPGLR